MTLLGRVGVAPQLRGLHTAHPVATFSLATSRNFKNADDEWARKTEWHNVAVFDNYLRDKVKENVAKGDLDMIIMSCMCV